MYESAKHAAPQPSHPAGGELISRADLERSARLFGEGYTFEGACPAPEDVVLTGRFNALSLRPGLILHAAEVRDLYAMRTRHNLHHTGIKVVVVVDGATDVSFGHRRLRLGPKGPDRQFRNQGMLLNLTEPTTFARQWEVGREERKVSLTLTGEWLEQGGLESHAAPAALRRFASEHLAMQPWRLTPRLQELASHILSPDAYLPGLHRLRLESRCLELVAEALQQLGGVAGAAPALSLSAQRRLRRLEELLYEDAVLEMSMEDIARAVGSNPTTLQALARQVWGTTLFERLREVRMAMARAALRRGESVAQAAQIAGYAAPTNFATAFRSRFGMTPRDVRKG